MELLNSIVFDNVKPYGVYIVLIVVSLFIANIIAQLLEFTHKIKINKLVNNLIVGKGGNTNGKTMNLLPIYIITGFLGSGKTTLLNNILKSMDHKMKFAVVVNEVGSVSIDHTLIEKNVNVDDGIIVMKNGCMCCVSSGTSGGIKGTSRILEQLVRIRDNGIAGLDGVFVELSGLADPAPTILTFLSEEFTHSNFYLDGIICLIDSSNFINDLNTKVLEVERQLSYSTLTVLNKLDLLLTSDNISDIGASTDEISENYDIAAAKKCINTIQGINPIAPILKTTYSAISLKDVLSKKSFDRSSFMSNNSNDTDNHDHHNHDHGHDHTNGIKSICVSSNRPVNRQLLYVWLHNILVAKSKDIYRTKGIVFMDDDLDNPIVIQGVHDVLKTSRLLDECEFTDLQSSNIVFIGKKLNQEVLQKEFLNCCE
jgi:G3E family GTPase